MRISIVIPVYNVAPYLRGCLDSVCAAAQELECRVGEWTGRPLVEIVCVDDGATDGSGAILDEYREKLEKRDDGGQWMGEFVVIHQQNAGVSAARNRGMREATGDYIWFVDADDEIERDSLRLLWDVIAKGDKPDVICFGSHAERSDLPLSAVPVKFDMDEVVQSREALRRWGGRLWAWNGLFRRVLTDGMKFKVYLNGEDTLWGYEALLKARSVWTLDCPLYVYRENSSGASRKFSIRHLESLWGVGGELADAFRHARHFDWYRRQLMRHLRGITHNGARVVTRALGAKGYSAWCDGARKIYLDSGIVQGWRRVLCQILLGFGWPWLIELFCFRPVEWKGRLIRMVRKCG